MATFEKNNRSCEFPTTWNWNVETPHQTFCKYRVLIQAGNRTYWSTYPVITCVILSPTPHLHGLWRSKISRKLHDSKQWQTTRCRISRKLHDSKRWPTTRSRISRKLHGGNGQQPPADCWPPFPTMELSRDDEESSTSKGKPDLAGASFLTDQLKKGLQVWQDTSTITAFCFKNTSSGLPFLIQAYRNTLKMNSTKINCYATYPAF